MPKVGVLIRWIICGTKTLLIQPSILVPRMHLVKLWNALSLQLGLFQHQFGKDAILVFGDHSRGNMAHQVAVRGQSVHDILHFQGGFQCALLDEFRISSYCCSCDSKVEMFMKRISPRPWQQRV
jgi:hypothetical protein